VLFLDAAALGATAAALVVAIGLPLAVRRALGPQSVLALGVAVGLIVTGVGAALLLRSVGSAMDRMLAAAESLGRDASGELPLVAPAGEESPRGLGSAAVAFERVVAALAAERQRLAEKVAELERTNRALAEARETSLRAERLATVGRLASGLAHEVGNPLGAVAGYVDLALGRLRAGAVDEAADLVARVGAEAARIDRIIRDLLDFARPLPPSIGPAAVATVMDGAVRLARVQPRFRDVKVEWDVPADLPPVLADEGRLAQVFLNLLLNAGDAMGGAGAVHVGARAAGGRVEVTVADRGPGIPPDALARIFDPFFTTKPPGAGTGLGLAVSHGIVQSMGGEISAENAPEGGAVFRVRIPVVEGR
jgi:C4-dicarboxylate-specific signal transduction histidine kinase